MGVYIDKNTTRYSLLKGETQGDFYVPAFLCFLDFKCPVCFAWHCTDSIRDTPHKQSSAPAKQLSTRPGALGVGDCWKEGEGGGWAAVTTASPRPRHTHMHTQAQSCHPDPNRRPSEPEDVTQTQLQLVSSSASPTHSGPGRLCRVSCFQWASLPTRLAPRRTRSHSILGQGGPLGDQKTLPLPIPGPSLALQP